MPDLPSPCPSLPPTRKWSVIITGPRCRSLHLSAVSQHRTWVSKSPKPNGKHAGRPSPEQAQAHACPRDCPPRAFSVRRLVRQAVNQSTQQAALCRGLSSIPWAEEEKVPFRALLWGKPRHEAGWFTRGRGHVLEQKEASLQIVDLILETLNLKTSLVKVKLHSLPARTAA